MPGVVENRELFSLPYIDGLVSEFAPNMVPLSQMYGIGPTAGGEWAPPAPQNAFFYEVFNNTRQTAGLQLGLQTTAVKAPKRGGKLFRGTILTSDEYIDFLDEDLMNLRDRGAPFSTVRSMAENRVAEQITTRLQSFSNLHEWAFASMIRGQMYLKKRANGQHYPHPTSEGADVTIEYPRQDGHRGQLPLGGATGTDPLITESWDLPSADIPAMFRNILAVIPRISGYGVTDVILPTKVANAMFNNAKMQAQGGTAFKVFDSINNRMGSTVAGQNLPNMLADIGQQAYYTVQWRALAGHQINFHVVDTGLYLPTGATDEEDAAQFWWKSVPENDIWILPAPRPNAWFRKYVRTQTRATSPQARPQQITGFGRIVHRLGGLHELPGRAIEFLDSFFYAPLVPRAYFTPTVIFPST